MMALNVDQQKRELIEQTVSVPWKQQVRYLGVKIVPTLEADKLIALNINPLFKEMQRYFEQWHPLGISWFAMVQTEKMKILPKFVYFSALNSFFAT